LGHTIGVFATLFTPDNRIVLVRQSYAGQCWTQPGGRLEDGEEPLEGLMREIREETGIEAYVQCFVGAYVNVVRNDVVLHFRASVLERGGWSKTSEIDECGEFAPDALPSPMRPHTMARIADAVAGRTNVFRSIPASQIYKLGELTTVLPPGGLAGNLD
jgi:8-oxo-dGTP diphosphatase